jgi:hypothetical protein
MSLPTRLSRPTRTSGGADSIVSLPKCVREQSVHHFHQPKRACSCWTDPMRHQEMWMESSALKGRWVRFECKMQLTPSIGTSVLTWQNSHVAKTRHHVQVTHRPPACALPRIACSARTRQRGSARQARAVSPLPGQSLHRGASEDAVPAACVCAL